MRWLTPVISTLNKLTQDCKFDSSPDFQSKNKWWWFTPLIPTQQAEAGVLYEFTPVGSMQGVTGQPGKHNETLTKPNE